VNYFKLTKKELANAFRILDHYSNDLNDYDISYGYDDDLNEDPENPQDMDRYADFLIARIRIEFEKSEDERDWMQIASGFGMAGSLKKMIGEVIDAEKLLSTSIDIIKQKNLPEAILIQQSIRLYDVNKRSGRAKEAFYGLSSLIESCQKNEALNNYLDVVFQHAGKAKFALNEYESALSFFKQALVLRIKKKNKGLTESSETAIQICQSKIDRLILK
jgi:tetratricopeptide (TPR) repeat protein